MLARYYNVDARKIEELLIAKGWAASKIADLGPFSTRTVDKILNNPKHRIFRTSLKRLADVFDVKPEEIIRSGPHPAVENDTAKKATFSLNMSNVPEDFDEASPHIATFFEYLRAVNVSFPVVVDYDEREGHVKLTIEVNVSSLPGLCLGLINGYIASIRPVGEPGTIQGGAFPSLRLLWWVDDLTFPDDCPLDLLRGVKLTSKNDFLWTKPFTEEEIDRVVDDVRRLKNPR